MATPAKLAAPRLPRSIVRRERLFRLLDEAIAQGAAWVAAPAGCGKTTLAADWARARGFRLVWYEADETDADAAGFLHFLRLAFEQVAVAGTLLPPAYTPDPRQPLAGIVRSFVRRLCACAPADALLVVDNAERLPATADGSRVLALLAAELTGALPLLVLSRSAPPPALARAWAGDRLAIIGWEALQFTAGESRQLVEHRAPALPAGLAAQLHAQTGGWAVGLRLLADLHAQEGQAGRERRAPVPIERQALFDYLGAEVFAGLPPAHQDMLLRLAPLEVIPPSVAVAASGQDDAPSVLDAMAGENFLTWRLPGPNPGFRLHPLLRTLLLQLEAQRDPDWRADTRRRAAAALARAGETTHAATLWLEARDAPGLLALLEDQGDELLRQGRHRTVLDWLRAAPAHWHAQWPQFTGWQVRALAPLAPMEALDLAQRAWPALERQAPPAQLADVWQAVVSAHVATGRLLDRWAPAGQALLQQLNAPEALPLRRRVLAASYAGFARSAPPAWDAAEQSALELVCDPSVPVETRLMLGARLRGGPGFWRQGAQALPFAVTEALRAACLDPRLPVIPRLCWAWGDAVALGWTGGAQALDLAIELLQQSAAAQREYGVHHFGFPHALQCQLAVHRGLLPQALQHAQALRSLPAPPPFAAFEIANRQQALAALALADGDVPAALAHARRFASAAREAASPFLEVLAQALLARAVARGGQAAAAAMTLREGLRAARRGRVAGPRGVLWLAAACISMEAGRRHAASAQAGRGLAILSSARLLRPGTATLTAAELARCCTLAWRAGSASGWVQHLVGECGLAPPDEAVCAGDWPWAVRIRSFGGLEIERAGERLAFGRKAPRRVLDLLRCLLVGGERGSPAAELQDMLWPELDGDDAQSAFRMALHRLRRLLGDEALDHSEGRVRIDARRVHVDCWAFERLLEGPQDESDLQRAVALYRGPFLGLEAPASTHTFREHLRARYRQAACGLTRSLLVRGEAAAAARVCEQALAFEPAAEDLYRTAIECCHAQGLRGEALRLLARAEAELLRAFGIGASPLTRRLATAGVAANPLPIGDAAPVP